MTRVRPPSLDADVDKLYQLPLDEFTAARNALAKEAGADGADVRQLQKPPVPAWAVNQLYWNNRPVYDALVDAASELRAAHKAVLSGKRGDLRGASKTHDEALDAALKATLELLAESGHPATDATRQAVLNILRALPSTDPPGRLARVLQPGGFEMISGFDIAPAKARQPEGRAQPRSAKAARGGKGAPARDERNAAAERRAAAREAVAEATRELRDVETELKRQEFTAARAAKESEKAASRLAQAREALEAAEREVEEAGRAATAADKARERARREAADAQVAVDTARARLERAQQALDDLKD